ncbi:hypothetical protein [Oricola sp.]|uniref:hypothetical protein n=1 Tax=Oricola sp. TaxID=1979950 RepID=UPI003BAB8ECD
MSMLHSYASAFAIAAITIAGFSTANAADRLDERMAPNAVSGNISVWGAGVIPSGYQNEDEDTCDPTDDGIDEFCESDFGFGSDARVHYDFGNGYAVQLETLLDYHLELDDDGDDERHAIHGAVAGHLIHRSGEIALGAFAGLTGTAHLDDDDRSVHGLIGAEAAMFSGANTFFGQVGLATPITREDAVDNLFFGRAGMRHFLSPNRRLEGAVAVGYSDDSDPGLDETEDLLWWQFTANYEQKFDDNPFSWFVGYQGDYLDNDLPEIDADESVWVHTVLAGFRMTFGETDTLQQQDNYGARTFDLTNLRAPLSYPDEL